MSTSDRLLQNISWPSRLRSVKIDLTLVLLLVLTLPALAPLLAPGYFYAAHDGRHSVFYLNMFDASLRDGAWWPRWAMHHIQGYGYPTFIIQAPLGFYLAEFFVLLGAGYTLAAKLTWCVGFLASAWGMYRLTVYWLTEGLRGESPRASVADQPEASLAIPRLAALLAGLVYVYAPYHLLDIYVRAALNDALLLAWFPWVFLAFDRLIVQGARFGWQRRLAIAMLMLAGVLLTHTFALISFAPLLVSFVLFRLINSWWFRQSDRSPQPDSGNGATELVQRALLAAAAGLGALLLYSAFLLPLLVEGQHLEQQVYVTNTYDFRQHFVFAGQFLSPFWGFGFSDDPAGVADGMSFQLGVMAVLLGIVGFYTQVQTPPRVLQQRGLMGYLTIATLALLFVMTPLAAPLWEALPALSVIQFPWRLLALTAFTLSALAGLACAHLLAEHLDDLEAATSGALVVAALILFASYAYVDANLQPVEPWREDGRAVYRFESEHPDMIAYTEWVEQPFTESPMTADYADPTYTEVRGHTESLQRLAILGGEGEVVSQYSRGSSMGGVVELAEASTVQVRVFFFPGWEARVDGVLTPIQISSPFGLIQMDVPAGEHRIDVRMGSTPIRQTGALLSWSMLLIVGLLWLWPSWQRRRGGARSI